MSLLDPKSATEKTLIGTSKQPKPRTVPKPNGAPEVTSNELRDWIDRVIVPILLQQYLEENRLRSEHSDG
jgi:hypothetical protein